MSEHEYAPAREPTESEWATRAKFLELGRSVPKTAFALGLSRQDVLRSVAACRWFLQDSGWTRRYGEAKAVGMSDADARLHADMEAAYFLREQSK